MKKFIGILIAILATVTFVGCASQTDECKIELLEQRISKLEKENEKLKEDVSQLGQLALQGEFYTLPEAYENGWLTKEDLMSIAYYHNGGTGGNEEVMGENYQPIPKTPQDLSDGVKLAIRVNYCNRYKNIPNTPSINNLADIGISEYCGQYNGSVAVVIGSPIAFTAITNETVDGVTFYFTYVNRIIIWNTK
ncbi:MAG: hypothetical protein HDQ88_03160 [Clostridia bacterium]|nr:hypothetical protein [Clostridia bacterium]